MTDPSGHLDLDALADVLAGERDDLHLRSCTRCADGLAELSAADASTAAALAALPLPAMPDGLALRLSQALDRERERESADVTDLRRASPVRTRRRQPAWLPAVAASAALVLAGTLGWSLLDLSGGAGQDAATSAAGGGGAADTASEAEPESAAGLALPGSGPTDWSDVAARPAALDRLLAGDDASGSALAVPSGDELARLREPQALAACVRGLPGGDEEVLAVDYAQYAGSPAVAVVQAAGPTAVTVSIVGSGCSAADPQLLDELQLPRP